MLPHRFHCPKDIAASCMATLPAPSILLKLCIMQRLKSRVATALRARKIMGAGLPKRTAPTCESTPLHDMPDERATAILEMIARQLTNENGCAQHAAQNRRCAEC